MEVLVKTAESEAAKRQRRLAPATCEAFVYSRFGNNNKSKPMAAMLKIRMRIQGGQYDSTATLVTVPESVVSVW
jgi:hypothetical protein